MCKIIRTIQQLYQQCQVGLRCIGKDGINTILPRESFDVLKKIKDDKSLLANSDYSEELLLFFINLKNSIVMYISGRMTGMYIKMMSLQWASMVDELGATIPPLTYNELYWGLQLLDKEGQCRVLSNENPQSINILLHDIGIGTKDSFVKDCISLNVNSACKAVYFELVNNPRVIENIVRIYWDSIKEGNIVATSASYEINQNNADKLQELISLDVNTTNENLIDDYLRLSDILETQRATIKSSFTWLTHYQHISEGMRIVLSKEWNKYSPFFEDVVLSNEKDLENSEFDAAWSISISLLRDAVLTLISEYAQNNEKYTPNYSIDSVSENFDAIEAWYTRFDSFVDECLILKRGIENEFIQRYRRNLIELIKGTDKGTGLYALAMLFFPIMPKPGRKKSNFDPASNTFPLIGISWNAKLPEPKSHAEVVAILKKYFTNLKRCPELDAKSVEPSRLLDYLAKQTVAGRRWIKDFIGDYWSPEMVKTFDKKLNPDKK